MPGNAGPTLKAGGGVGLGGRDSGSQLSTFVTFDLQVVQQYLGCWFQHRTLLTDQRGNVLILMLVVLMNAGCPHCKRKPPSTLWWWPCQTHPQNTGGCVSHSTYTTGLRPAASSRTVSKLTMTAKFSRNTWCVLGLWGLSSSSLGNSNLCSRERVQSSSATKRQDRVQSSSTTKNKNKSKTLSAASSWNI